MPRRGGSRTLIRCVVARGNLHRWPHAGSAHRRASRRVVGSSVLSRRTSMTSTNRISAPTSRETIVCAVEVVLVEKAETGGADNDGAHDGRTLHPLGLAHQSPWCSSHVGSPAQVVAGDPAGRGGRGLYTAPRQCACPPATLAHSPASYSPSCPPRTNLRRPVAASGRADLATQIAHFDARTSDARLERSALPGRSGASWPVAGVL